VTFNVADTTPPTVTINQAAGQADPTSAAPITFTAVFSESVSGFTGSDVTIRDPEGGRMNATLVAVPGAYIVSLRGMTTCATLITPIPSTLATDAAVNTISLPNALPICVTFNVADTTPPTVTINQAAGQADPTSASPITFTAVFSEPVSGFTGSDVTI